MYDAFAEECLRHLPADLDNTDWQECRRRLSRLYFALIQLRLYDGDMGESQETIVQTCEYLRRLSNTIEQYLFNESISQEEEDLKRRRSYAFIAAEAIDLWCSFAQGVSSDIGNSGSEIAYAKIESALLYLASDYQINAHCSAKEINEELFLVTYDNDQHEREVIEYLQNVICAFATGRLNALPEAPIIDYGHFSVVIKARVAIMVRIGALVESYAYWLTGEGIKYTILDEFQHLLDEIHPSSNFFVNSQFADLHHLCTLLFYVVSSSYPLSLIHQLPRLNFPEEESVIYENYLKNRASHRPFLWPSAKEYIHEAFPGPHSDAVVVIPTGSGKSFLAELACSQAMQSSWVLYLAPTNALVRQVQRDLTKAFRPFTETQILSFVGGQEYTNLKGEQLESPPNMSVAVMTPEKCAMAFRLNLKVFQNCGLCIVDEFHTINDDRRGITLDLCLAQIFTHNPETRFLLMSAMVSNGEEAAEWISKMRGERKVPLVQIPWRPCRTLRSLLVVQREGAENKFNEAKNQFENLNARRKNVAFAAPLGLLGGMCLQWEKGGEEADYVAIPVPANFVAKAKRGSLEMLQGGADWDGWKNTVGRDVAELFHKGGSNVLCFVLTSRHHVFSSAEKCSLEGDVSLDQHTKGLLGLANAELGQESKVEELLKKGIGVHSSAMLDTEQGAVERSFGKRDIGLLFATPTLAQGLNLPADIVIVAGSSLGDARQTKTLHGARSSDATILNAFGRAGRAMITNHGLAVLVSDNPFFAPISEEIGVDAVVDRYKLLSGSDRCVQISSPINSFVRRLNPDESIDAYSLEELELVAQLGVERGDNTEVLRHTFGAFLAAKQEKKISLEAAAGRIQEIGSRLVNEHNMPEWMPTAAMKGGIDLLTCWRMWQSLSLYCRSTEEVEVAELRSCLNLLVEVMSRMPPKDIRKILPDSVRRMNTVLDKMLACLGENEFAVDWESPAGWNDLWIDLSNLIWMYMDGGTYSKMAASFLSIEEEAVHGRRNQGQAPIPAVFSFVGRVLHYLSIYAGALLVILEESKIIDNQLGDMPLLPLCIRNGCCSHDSLAWFRYGYRNRIAAHEFAQTFKIPPEIRDDGEVKKWIKQQRIIWLRNSDPDLDTDVMHSVRLVLDN